MYVKEFLSAEDGAVSVDWVVLTAAVVTLGVVISATIQPQVDGIAGQIGNDIATQLNASGLTDGGYAG